MNSAHVFHKILVPIDFSEASLAALSQAILVGKVYGAPITVIHVVPPVESTVGFAPAPETYLTGWQPTETASELEQRLEAIALEQLHDAVAHHHAEGVDLEYRVLWGAAFREAIHLVQEEGFDLVVVGTRGRSALSRVFAESTSTKLVRKCPCPVWVVQPNLKASLDVILAPIDFSDVSHESLHLAGALATAFHASLHVMHVCAAEYGYLLDLLADDEPDLYPPWHRHEVISQLHEFVKDSGVSIEPVLHVERGDVAQHILGTADRIDAGLIAMGTLGRRGVAGLLIGNTAEKVLHHSHRPLLAAKPVGYVSPVLPKFSSVEA